MVTGFSGLQKSRIIAGMPRTSAPQAWLLLRGLGRETRHWFEFSSLLSRRLGVPSIGVDLPGAGKARRSRVPLSISAMARDVARRLDTEPLGSSFGIVAISLGSMVALAMAEQLPSRIERLVLINPSTRLSSPFERLRPGAFLTLLGGAFCRSAATRERIYYGLTTNAPRAEVELWSRRSAQLASESPARRRDVARQLLAASRFRAPRVSQPTLILSARGDRLVSPVCSEALASFLGAHHEQHPTAGHDLPLEAGDWIIDRIVDWLAAGVESARSGVQPVANQRS